MYRGRFQLGQEVPLGVLCRNASDTPTNPDAAPLVDIYNDAGSKVISGHRLPLVDRGGQAGYFARRFFLDGRFAVGRYSVVYRYVISSYIGREEDCFEVMAGGSKRGSIIGLYWFDRPQAKFLVQHLDSGQVRQSRNPRV